MKSTGIVRTIDELGRIVLPKELRKTLNINPRDQFEFYVENDSIVLKRNESACVFCNRMEDTFLYEGQSFCVKCMIKMAEQRSK